MRYFEYFCILLQGLHAFILDKDAASAFLNRKPRENDFGGLDEVVGDSFERECIEESCENEEFHEVYDDWFSLGWFTAYLANVYLTKLQGPILPRASRDRINP